MLRRRKATGRVKPVRRFGPESLEIRNLMTTIVGDSVTGEPRKLEAGTRAACTSFDNAKSQHRYFAVWRK